MWALVTLREKDKTALPEIVYANLNSALRHHSDIKYISSSAIYSCEGCEFQHYSTQNGTGTIIHLNEPISSKGNFILFSPTLFVPLKGFKFNILIIFATLLSTFLSKAGF